MATITEERFEKVTFRAKKNSVTQDQNADEMTPFDIMRPKNEPGFFKYLRDLEKRAGFVTPVKWMNVIVIGGIHVASLWWAFEIIFFKWSFPKFLTVAYNYTLIRVAGFGVTGGAHRLWTHRSYKAKTPLQIILLICYSVAFQNTIPEWVQDHRVHHKFSETSADPHDSRRGLFFSHVGWLLTRKHPDVVREGRKLDMSDILDDPLIRFHTKYFRLLTFLFGVILPPILPVVLWGEDPWICFVTTVLFRFLITTHGTWAVNSFAHEYGNKPYNKNIKPSENYWVSAAAMGEGWHNYHHTFPWDYKTSELGQTPNTTTALIELFAKIGWAYDLKTSSQSVVDAMKKKQLENNH